MNALAPLAASQRVPCLADECHAECGAFTAGLAMAEEGLRLAEIAHDPFSQLRRAYGVSLVYRRQGDMPRALPMLERAMGLCQEWHIPLFLPRYTAALGLTYALAGRVAAGLALVEQGMEQTVARGRPRGLALVVTWLSEAYLLAGRLEEARQRAAQAVDLARQHQQRGTQAWALWLLGEIGAPGVSRGSSQPPTTTARPSPWPRNSVCARSRRIVMLVSGLLYQQDGTAGAGSNCPIHRHRALTAPWR